jgi:hypothetical protein
VTTRRPPLLVPGAVLGVLLVAGCSSTTAGTPTVPSSATSALPPSAAAPDTPGTCTVVVGSGSVSSRGGSSRVSTVNGITTLTCGSGPAMTIAEIGAAGVTLQLAGGPTTTIAPGGSAPVGPYTVGVDGVTGGKATMRVAPPR